MGDFNEILFANEKVGWLDRSERQMQGFRDALNYCALKDMGYTGFPYTWCNRRPGDQNTWIRLDRGDCRLGFSISSFSYSSSGCFSL